MSWFQSSFSAATSGLASTINNLSGQLNDLTQDVLQEGVQSSFLEEVEDVGERREEGSAYAVSAEKLELAAAPVRKDEARVDGEKGGSRSSPFQPAILSLDSEAREDNWRDLKAESLSGVLRDALKTESATQVRNEVTSVNERVSSQKLGEDRLRRDVERLSAELKRAKDTESQLRAQLEATLDDARAARESETRSRDQLRKYKEEMEESLGEFRRRLEESREEAEKAKASEMESRHRCGESLERVEEMKRKEEEADRSRDELNRRLEVGENEVREMKEKEEEAIRSREEMSRRLEVNQKKMEEVKEKLIEEKRAEVEEAKNAEAEARRRLGEGEKLLTAVKDEHQNELASVQESFHEKIASLQDQLWSRGPVDQLSHRLDRLGDQSAATDADDPARLTLISPPTDEDENQILSTKVHQLVDDSERRTQSFPPHALLTHDSAEKDVPLSASASDVDAVLSPRECPTSPSSDTPCPQDGIDQLRQQVAHLERLLREERRSKGEGSSRRSASDDGGGGVGGGSAGSGGSRTSSGFEFVEKAFSPKGASTASSTSEGDEVGMKGVQLIGGFEDDNLYEMETGRGETGDTGGEGSGGSEGAGGGGREEMRSTDEEASGEGEKDLVEIWEAQVEKLLEANKRLEAERDLMGERLDRLKAEGRERIEALRVVVKDKESEAATLREALQLAVKDGEARVKGGSATDAEVSALKTELTSKSERIRTLEDEKRELEENLEQLDEENAVANKTLIDQRDKLKSELNRALAKASEDPEARKEEDGMAEEEKMLKREKDVETERNEMEEEREASKEERVRLEEEMRKIENDKTEVEKRMGEIGEKMSALECERKAFEEEREKVREEERGRKVEMEVEKERIRAEKATYEAEMVEFERNKSELEEEKRKVEESKCAVEKEKEKWEMEKEEVEAEKLTIDNRKEELAREGKEMRSAMDERREAMEAEQEAMEAEKEAIEAEKEAIGAEKKSITDAKSVLDEEEKRWKKEMEALNSEKMRVERDSVAAKEKGDEDGKRVEELRRKLESDRIELEAERESVRTDRATIEEEKDAMRDKIAVVEEERKRLELEKGEAEGVGEKVEVEAEEMKNRLADEEKKRRALEERVAELESRVMSAKNEAEGLREEKGELTLEIESLQLGLEGSRLESSQLAERNEETEKLQTQIQVLREEKRSLEEEMDDVERRNLKEKKEYEKTIGDFVKVREEGDDELKLRLDTLLKEMHEKEKELSQAHEQIVTLENQVKDHRSMMESVVEGQDKVAEILSEREADLARIKREKEELKTELERATVEVFGLRDNIGESSLEVSKLKEERLTLRHQLDALLEEQQRAQTQEATQSISNSDSSTLVVVEESVVVAIDDDASAADINVADSDVDTPHVAVFDVTAPDDASSVNYASPSMSAEDAALIGGMTDAEKMETKTLDLITEMEKKIMDHEKEKREWGEKIEEMERMVATLTESHTRAEQARSVVEVGGDDADASEGSAEDDAPSAGTGASLASVLEEKRVLIEEAAAYQKERDQLTAMISNKHRECLEYYQQLTNVMTAYQTVMSEKEEIRLQLEEQRSVNDEKRASNDHIDDEGKDDDDDPRSVEREESDEEKEEFQGQLQRLKGEMREIGLSLLACKEELAGEKETKEILFEENEELRQTLDAHSLLDPSKFPPHQQQQQQQQQQQPPPLIASSTDTPAATKSSEELTSRLNEAKASERQLLRKVVQLNETAEKLGREKDRLKEEILRVNEAQERDAVAWREKEADLEARLEAALERANLTSTKLANVESRSVSKEQILSKDVVTLTKERDEARDQLAAANNNVHQYARAVANLQGVLEQFQRESETRLEAESRRCQQELASSREREAAADARTKQAEAKIIELEAAVAAAKRLNEQIIKKEMIVAETKKKLEERDQQLKSTVIALGELKCSSDSKVDKALVKSLILGFLRAPRGHQREALPPLGAVLEFSPTETREAAYAVQSGEAGIIGGIANKIGGIVNNARGVSVTSETGSPALNASLSEMFVQFLREESIQTPVLPLPAEDMAKDQIRAAATSAAAAAAAAAAASSSSAQRSSSSTPALVTGGKKHSSPSLAKRASPLHPPAPLQPIVPLTVPGLDFGASPLLPHSTLSSSLGQAHSSTPVTTYSLISPMDPLRPLFSPLPPKGSPS